MVTKQEFDAQLGTLENIVRDLIREKVKDKEEAKEFRDSMMTTLDELGDLFDELTEYEDDEDED